MRGATAKGRVGSPTAPTDAASQPEALVRDATTIPIRRRARLMTTTLVAASLACVAMVSAQAQAQSKAPAADVYNCASGTISRTGVCLKFPRCTGDQLRAEDTYCYRDSGDENTYCYHGAAKQLCYAADAEIVSAENAATPQAAPRPTSRSAPTGQPRSVGSSRSIAGAPVETPETLEARPVDVAAGWPSSRSPSVARSARDPDLRDHLDEMRRFIAGYDLRYTALASRFPPTSSCRSRLRQLYVRASIGVRDRPSQAGASACAQWGSPASRLRLADCGGEDGVFRGEFSPECVAARLRDVAIATHELQERRDVDIYGGYLRHAFISDNFNNPESFAREMSCMIDSLKVSFTLACSDAAQSLDAAGDSLQGTGFALGSYVQEVNGKCGDVVRDICAQVTPILEEAEIEIEGIGRPQ